MSARRPASSSTSGVPARSVGFRTTTTLVLFLLLLNVCQSLAFVVDNDGESVLRGPQQRPTRGLARSSFSRKRIARRASELASDNPFQDESNGEDPSLLPLIRRGREAEDESGSTSTTTPPTPTEPRIISIRLARTHKDVNYGDDGEISALKGKDIHLYLYGVGLSSAVKVKLTTAEADYGELCQSEAKHHLQTESFSIGADEGGISAYLRIPGAKLPVTDQKIFYFCLSHDGKDFVHQGGDTGAQIEVYELILPVWLLIIFIGVLLTLSGIFSGLNLGLMALDQTELKIVQNTGTENERRYANKIAPIRKHGNYLLCTLLLGNVLVNNTLTILLDTLTSGLVAVIGATMGIVVFGEIIPQAICSRHGLAVGSHTIWLTKFFMLLTFPLAFPISKILDKVLGAEIGTVYDKKKLIELLRVTHATNDLEKEEVDIVTGALVYKDKKVRDVMTKLEDVYMLSLQTELDFETVSDIRAQGYSRIPIFNDDRKNIVHILFAKDLMFIDPDDKMPLAMVCEFYSNDVNFVFHDTPLNIMFNEFKSGDKGHMAFVQDINAQGDGDPFYETIGLVTLEDIIEEIIQQEIVDETDVITDNKTKKRRKRDGWQGMEGNFQKFNNEEKRHVTISPQLSLAVFQYLTTSIEPFKYPKVSDSVLKRLLSMDVFREIKFKKDKTKMNEKDVIIISKGKIIDFFILIIEGKVEVNIGPEELVFESGPFTYFGIQALINVLSEADPSSPVISASGGVVRAVTNPLSLTSSAAPIVESSTRASLRKASTQNALDFIQPHSQSKRNSVVQADTTSLSKNVDGLSNKMTPATSSNIIPPFIPDYTVKAVSDVLYLRIRRATYIAAIKASLIKKTPGQGGELNDGELDNLLEKIAEDNADNDPSVLMRTPSMRSPVMQQLDSVARSLAGSPLQKETSSLRSRHASPEEKSTWGASAEQHFSGRSSPTDKRTSSDVSGGGANGPASWPSSSNRANEISDRTSFLIKLGEENEPNSNGS